MVKRQRGRSWLGLTRQVVSVRPYPSLASLWQMVARSAYTQLRYSPAILAGTLGGLLFLYLLPPAGVVIGLVVLLAGDGPAGPAALAAGAVQVERVQRLVGDDRVRPVLPGPHQRGGHGPRPRPHRDAGGGVRGVRVVHRA